MSDVQHIKHFDMSDAVERAKDKWLLEAGISIAGQATELAPRDTGRLKGSVTWATKDSFGGLNEGRDAKGASRQDGVSNPSSKDEVWIGTNVEYAEWMEYGTRKYPTGQPYLRPALRVMKKRLKALWNKYMKEAQRG